MYIYIYIHIFTWFNDSHRGFRVAISSWVWFDGFAGTMGTVSSHSSFNRLKKGINPFLLALCCTHMQRQQFQWFFKARESEIWVRWASSIWTFKYNWYMKLIFINHDLWTQVLLSHVLEKSSEYWGQEQHNVSQGGIIECEWDSDNQQLLPNCLSILNDSKLFTCLQLGQNSSVYKPFKLFDSGCFKITISLHLRNWSSSNCWHW